jgi:hypothetical protein
LLLLLLLLLLLPCRRDDYATQEDKRRRHSGRNSQHVSARRAVLYRTRTSPRCSARAGPGAARRDQELEVHARVRVRVYSVHS